MEYKVTVNFYESTVIEINVENPEDAANAALKLFKQGRLKPQINDVTVFDVGDEFGLETPLYIFKPEIGS
jgi:hypothetical protein